jgi:hypothetical protein
MLLAIRSGDDAECKILLDWVRWLCRVIRGKEYYIVALTLLCCFREMH